MRLSDGQIVPAVIVLFAVPLVRGDGKSGPALTSEDVLDGAATVIHPGEFGAFLAALRPVRDGLRQEGKVP